MQLLMEFDQSWFSGVQSPTQDILNGFAHIDNVVIFISDFGDELVHVVSDCAIVKNLCPVQP